MAIMAMPTFEMLHVIGMQAGAERHLFESTKRAVISYDIGRKYCNMVSTKIVLILNGA